MKDIPQKELIIRFQNSSSSTFAVQSAALTAGEWGSGPTDRPSIGDQIEPGASRTYKTVTNFVSGLSGQIQLITFGSGILFIIWEWPAQAALIFNAFIQNAGNLTVTSSNAGGSTSQTGFVTTTNSSVFIFPSLFLDQQS